MPALLSVLGLRFSARHSLTVGFSQVAFSLKTQNSRLRTDCYPGGNRICALVSTIH